MRRALAPVLAATLLLSISACSSDDESPKADASASVEAPSPSESSEPTETTAAPSESSEPPATTAAPSSEAEVKTGTIKDDIFGHTIDATGVVRNFPFPASMSAVEERGDTELVLVDIEAKAGKAYFVTLSDGDFRVSASKDDAEAAVSTSTAETEMAAAGFKPFEEVDEGKSGGGWIAFTVRDTTDAPLFLSYKRLEANNGDIPEKVFTVPLTPVV